MDELGLLGKLFEYGLGVAIMGYAWYVTRQDLKKEREKLEERDQYIRESDRENLLVLRTMSQAIDKIGEDGKREFAGLKNHIDSRVKDLQNHIDKSK